MGEEIVGYTAGVFDLFHVGHLNILKRSKMHCDYLIVAVSTDELVVNYKHKTPIVPFEQRIQIVESIKYVDRVVAQTERDKISAFKQYKFDILFVGDDWKGDSIFEDVDAFMKDNGARGVKYFPYTKGVSTTLLGETVVRHSYSMG